MDKVRLDDGSVLVRFELPAAVGATTVSVCGDFNGWTSDTHPLDRLGDGRFRAEIPLPAGDRWRFRYLLDGRRWENDWAADDYVPNGFGEDNSVVDLTDPRGLPLSGAAAPAVPATEAAPSEEPSEQPSEEPSEQQDMPGVDGAATGDDAPAERRPGLLRRWWHRLTRWWRRLTRRDTPPATASGPTDGPAAPPEADPAPEQATDAGELVDSST